MTPLDDGPQPPPEAPVPRRQDVDTFFREAFAEHIPVSMHLDITWRCDHKCVHCYLTARRQPELTLAEYERILDEFAEAGVMSLLISGGDPFLRPDALDIIRAARQRQFDVKINTHGNFIDDAVADALAELGLHKVSLSVYSAFAEEHEAVTLIPGSHQKTLDAAARLRARGVAVNFKTPLMTHNRRGWHGVKALAETIGAQWQCDASIVNDDQSDFGVCSIGVHVTERMLAVMQSVADRRDEVHTVASLPEKATSDRTCSAGTLSGYLSPDGRLYPCINWRDAIGSLREDRFLDLWDHSATIARQREITRASYLKDCGGCTFQGKCSYCPGISHAETGDAGRRSAYVCERTHMTMGALEYLERLNAEGAPIPEPGSAEAEAMFNQAPTFAERQFHTRRQGLAQPGHGLGIGLDDAARLAAVAGPRPAPLVIHPAHPGRPSAGLVHIHDPRKS